MADFTLELFLLRVGQTVVFVVSFLVESLAAELTNEGLIASVNQHVSVKGRRAVESFATSLALVRLL